jgi:hypothetical protein
MSRKRSAIEMQAEVEREILELLDQHGEMPTWKVRSLVKTGRRVLASNEHITLHDHWSMTYIRNRLYELSPRVTYGVALWGSARIPQFVWRLADTQIDTPGGMTPCARLPPPPSHSRCDPNEVSRSIVTADPPPELGL